MKPTHKMIHALRVAAKMIEAPSQPGKVNYDWGVPSRCNCGMLLRVLDPEVAVESDKYESDPATVRPLSITEIVVALYKYGRGVGYWQAMDGLFKDELTCKITNLPVTELHQRLTALGFEKGDFEDIEFTGNSTQRGLGHSKPCVAAAHMRKRADELAARRRAMAEARLAKMKARHQPVAEVVEEEEVVQSVEVRRT